MAIRVRLLKGRWVAFCAAVTDPEPKDLYVDDAQDHALRRKYIADYLREGLISKTDYKKDTKMKSKQNSGYQPEGEDILNPVPPHGESILKPPMHTINYGRGIRLEISLDILKTILASKSIPQSQLEALVEKSVKIADLLIEKVGVT